MQVNQPQPQPLQIVTRPRWSEVRDIVIYCDAALCKNQLATEPDEHYSSTTLGGIATIVTVNGKLYSATLSPVMGSIQNNNVLEARAIVRGMRYVHDKLEGHVTIASDAQSIIEKWSSNRDTPDTKLSYIAYKRYKETTNTTLTWVPREMPLQRLADLSANLAGGLRHELTYVGTELQPLIECFYQSWHNYRGK